MLMPFGWQEIGYIPMAWGTHLMIAMAGWVTSLPEASLHVPSPTDAGLMMASFGLLWLCLLTKLIRYLGVLAIAAGLLTTYQHVPPDILISNDAHQVMVRLPGGHYTTLRGTARSFVVQNWLRAEAEDELVPVKETDADCDRIGCLYRNDRYSVILMKKSDDDEALDGACQQKVDVLIAWRYLHADNCPGPKILIGRAELEAGGAHALYFQNHGVKIAKTLESGEGRRIWQPPPTPSSEGEE